jgi:hypothetical protein
MSVHPMPGPAVEKPAPRNMMLRCHEPDLVIRRSVMVAGVAAALANHRGSASEASINSNGEACGCILRGAQASTPSREWAQMKWHPLRPFGELGREGSRSVELTRTGIFAAPPTASRGLPGPSRASQGKSIQRLVCKVRGAPLTAIRCDTRAPSPQADHRVGHPVLLEPFA